MIAVSVAPWSVTPRGRSPRPALVDAQDRPTPPPGPPGGARQKRATSHTLRAAEQRRDYRGNVAASFFSRSSAAHTPRAERPGESARPLASVDAPTDAALERWRSELAAVTAADPGSEEVPRLTLAQAHPGGLAQLYAEHTTKLANLVREPVSYAHALERARDVLERSRQLTARHGVGPVHLAIGSARWREDGEQLASPALLRPVSLDIDEDGDVLISLRPGAQVGPGLARALARRRVVVDVHALLADATTVHGFSPSRALATLRGIGAALDRFDLRDDLVLGIFEHPAAGLLHELDHPATLLTSEVVRALAGDGDARSRTTLALPAPNPADRDPWSELGAGDLTPRQQDVVEAVSQGRSMVVDVPHGADDTTVLVSLLVDAAAKGRSILHVAGSPSRTARVEARLGALGVEEMAVRIDGTADARQRLRDLLTTAMSDTSSVVDHGEVERMRTQLRRVREALSLHTTYLHRPFRQFGVSAFDALQVLTDLTGTHPGPRTRVRLREDILVDIARDQGERARTLLHRASTLGLFSRSSAHTAWAGVVINAPEQVNDALVRITRLEAETLPRMRVQMAAVAGETGLRVATTLAQWEEQLLMLEGVRDVLDVFRPEVFERSAADMVIATAPKQWRRDHGITMGHAARTRLVKQAKDLVRPGRHVEDLHRELLLVQERRDLWRRHCASDGWPVLPQRLDEIGELASSVRLDLDRLAPLLSTAHPDLARMDVTELGHLMEGFAEDPEGARELPQRVAVLKDLSAAGLEDLTADLRGRHVDDDLIDAELDLAWWASLLGLMLAEEPRLGGFDPARLEGMLAEGRDLDREQVASLAPQALDQLRRLRQQALATRPEQQTDLQTALGGADSAADVYARHPLAWHMVPLVLTVPTLVPWLVPEGHRVDLVVLDDVDDLPLAELVPIIARARQVVLLADLSAGVPEGPSRQVAEVLPVAHLEVAPARLNDQVARLLTRYAVDHVGVPVPWTSASGPVSAVWTEGAGMPAPGAGAVESTAEEVDAVIELVIAHAVERPDQSLAVIALNVRHAERLRQRITQAVNGQPALADFFSEDRVEPFVVVDVAGARGLSRDRVVVSVGYAKTPHGRVLHDFGEISTARGVGLLSDALRAVRGDLTVVSSIHADEVDPSRLSSEGARMLVDLLEVAQGEAAVEHSPWPTLQEAPDRLLVDLADRLYGMGLEVLPNVGVEGGMRIPLAIGHPEVPGRLLVAVLTDDADYVAEPSLRLRDRLRPAMLEEQGWKVRTELSMAVFIDPEKEAQDIVTLVLDAVDEINGPLEPEVEIPSDALLEETAPETEDGVDLGADDLDEVVARTDEERERADELHTGMLERLVVEATPEREPRPAIARGLPLAAYGDDQLDELALWVRSDGLERTTEELVEALRSALGLTRRGAQSDAVLTNVVRRTEPRR